jgi:hypothetical protein
MRKKRKNRGRGQRNTAWMPGSEKYEEGVEQRLENAFAVPPGIIAACSGLSTVTVHTLQKRAIIKQSAPGKYHLYETMQAIVNYMKQGDAFSSLATKRERKIAEEIRKIQLSNDVEEGKLIPMDHAKNVVSEAMATVRMGHEALGGRLANELAGIDDPAKVRAVLQRETRAIDKDAVDIFKKMAVVRDGDEEPDEEEEEVEEQPEKRKRA